MTKRSYDPFNQLYSGGSSFERVGLYWAVGLLSWKYLDRIDVTSLALRQRKDALL